MQEQDAVSIEYFEDEERFADLLNGYLFHGRELVKAEDIQEKNRSVSLIRKNKGKMKAEVLMRDVMRQVNIQLKIVLVSLENQSDIHYAMPVRVLSGDGAAYHEQWRKLAKKHRRKKDLKGAEFLSGFGKGDRLVPVMTLVLYFGNEPWDGPKSLKEMMDFTAMPEEVKETVADYPIHLLEVRNYPYLENFRTDLRYVFGFLQNTKSREELKNYVNENREIFEELEEDAYDFISVMSHSPELKKIKKNNQTEGGRYNMCKAIQEMIEESKREGRQEGRQEGIQLTKKIYRSHMSGMSYKKISKKYKISVGEVREILDDTTE
ncbi:MAG: Rpn family recombination-promoting nuclease/putative transposase [Eubacteriales bacterium]|nr:Rpn family recombination-promoting nuclease/putative transposase [Eubacteriales bacterium]